MNSRVLAGFFVCCIFLAGQASGQETPNAKNPASALEALEILPKTVSLTGPRSRQQLIALGRYDDGSARDLSRQVAWNVADTSAAKIENGALRPLANGMTKITAVLGPVSAHTDVAVKEMKNDRPVSFRGEVIPLLTKLGCNQGACHGAQYGKGGFRLSLFGFDPDFDHEQIVQSAEGRRVVLSDPERSILLLKPSLLMEHGGGERMQAGSWQYQLLKEWLETGATAPRENDPVVTGLEINPARRIMTPNETQQILVRAIWSNGRQEDATRNARYDSLNDAIAAVTPSGFVKSMERGETHIMIRYGGHAAVFQVTVPYLTATAAAKPVRHNFVDDHLNAKWQTIGLAPSALCSDEEFFRRIHLDTIGTLPTPEEVRAFLADRDPPKRGKAVDRVLDRPEFVDYWALKWGDLLRSNRNDLEEKGMWSFHNWIRASLRDEKPADEFVRDIITAQGSTFLDGPANYYRIGRTAADWAETTSQVFLGVRIQCAKCHQHPFEQWTQEDYYRMAAFFARMGTKNSQEFGIFGRETVVHLRPTGEARHPKKGTVVMPRPLAGPEMDDPFDRRNKLADWATAKNNPFFARNIVNRFWGYYMGRGIVEPLDDVRATNPPSNPELLDALAKDFADNGFKLKHLMRTIMNARAYQLSSLVTPGNEADKENRFFARYTIKRLSAEQLADAVDDATGTREKYPGLPLGTRAIQLPDPGVRSFFLDVFGRPARQLTCECERTMAPNIAQALHLMNGDLINAKIARNDGRIAKLAAAKKSPAELIEEIYLVTLSRPPRAEEKEKALQWIAKAPNPRAGAEDLLWVLLNSREFLFNH